jgi:hypothetical protein
MPLTQQKSPRGRPPLPSEKVRHNRVVTFLTDREMQQLKKISQKESKTLSAVCHKIITRHLQKAT